MPKDKRTIAIAEGNTAVLKVISDMPSPDRDIGNRLHSIISASAPDLFPRTWYCMPAYTDGNKIICFFRSRQKFGERYMTIGFNDSAKLDDGFMWPVSYALTKLTDAEEKIISKIVKKSVQK